MTLFIQRNGYQTIYYYGAVMVIVTDPFLTGEEEEYQTHQLKDTEHSEDNNRIMWEKW